MQIICTDLYIIVNSYKNCYNFLCYVGSIQIILNVIKFFMLYLFISVKL